MAKKIKFELDLDGLSQLMKSDKMRAAVTTAAHAVARHAGDGVEIETGDIWQGRWVAGAQVIAKSEKAIADNLVDNTLIKAAEATGLTMKK